MTNNTSIHNSVKRLVLGTAQLGMDYGVANKTGKPDAEESYKIIKAVLEAGIEEFDTAQAYGSSERLLGETLSSLGKSDSVRIITKPIIDINSISDKTLQSAAEQSLKNLGANRLYGFLLHEGRLLEKWNKGLGKSMMKLIDDGLVENIGASVYAPLKAIKVLEIDDIGMIQIPSNVLDRRFEVTGLFEEAKRLNKQIYVRSVFLQGILLMEPEDLPKRLSFAAHTIEAFKMFSDKTGNNRRVLSLAYVRDNYPDAKIIFGAESYEQIIDNIISWKTAIDIETVKNMQKSFQNVDSKILNPAIW